MTDREIREWASRVVDLYLRRASMNLLEQGELLRAVAGLLRMADQAGDPVDRWADIANRAFEEWERDHPHRGARVSGFSLTGKQVFEKRRNG